MRPLATIRAGRWMFIVSILFVFPTFLRAQAQAPTPSDDAEWRRQMERRMQQLEQENADLRQQVTATATTTRPDAAAHQREVEQTEEAMRRDAASRELTIQNRPETTTPPTFDIHKYVATGNFPGSITIPGTNISIQIGGFVQLDAITDSHTIGSPDSFIVSSIPTAGETAGQTNFSVRQTRVFVKTDAPTAWGQLVTYVEGDFFGPDGTDFRIRHAYGEIGNKHKLLAGQTWSTFMDASVYPAIFDYQGPNAMVLVRQPMIRYTEVVRDDLQWQVAVEDPNPDLSTATGTAGTDSAVWPDFTANVRWSPDWGHLQLAGILRQLTFDPAVGPRSTDVGWGANFTGQVNVFAPIAKGKPDNIVFQVVGGQGIENYINDTNGLGLDGFLNTSGNLSALSTWGGFAAYQHYWTPQWASSFGYSYLKVEGNSQQPADAYQSGHYAVVNLMWYPVERIWCGLECLYGIREDRNGDTGDDLRLSVSVQYRF